MLAIQPVDQHTLSHWYCRGKPLRTSLHSSFTEMHNQIAAFVLNRKDENVQIFRLSLAGKAKRLQSQTIAISWFFGPPDSAVLKRRKKKRCSAKRKMRYKIKRINKCRKSSRYGKNNRKGSDSKQHKNANLHEENQVKRRAFIAHFDANKSIGGEKKRTIVPDEEEHAGYKRRAQRAGEKARPNMFWW